VLAVPGRADGTRSRTRVRLHVDRTGRVGPYAARTKRVVPVRDLPLAVEPLERLMPEQARGRELDLVATAADAFAAGPRDARPPIVERVGDREFRLEALGFWQVHPAAPAVLTDAVRAAVDPALLDPDADNLDLYGGVGLLAAALADGADVRVTTVESDRAATGHAAENLADLPRAAAVQARVDAFLAEERSRPGATVLLDPPRSGAGRDIVDAIVASGPAQVVYVACDPVALARDLGTFAAHGWRAATLDAFDLFPNTHHLEAVVRLVREA
jgi:tRNA/tmRNA/rRNA uracil-C5-methylase (TrmA/RlmC/RlmD family)